MLIAYLPDEVLTKAYIFSSAPVPRNATLERGPCEPGGFHGVTRALGIFAAFVCADEFLHYGNSSGGHGANACTVGVLYGSCAFACTFNEESTTVAVDTDTLVAHSPSDTGIDEIAIATEQGHEVGGRLFGKLKGHFVGFENFIDLKHSEGTRWTAADGSVLEIAHPKEGRDTTRACIRPDDILVAAAGEDVANAVSGKVGVRTYLGKRMQYNVETALGELIVNTSNDRLFDVGENITLSLDAHKIVMV